MRPPLFTLPSITYDLMAAEAYMARTAHHYESVNRAVSNVLACNTAAIHYCMMCYTEKAE